VARLTPCAFNKFKQELPFLVIDPAACPTSLLAMAEGVMTTDVPAVGVPATIVAHFISSCEVGRLL
jgi:hypothetical protein